MQSKKSKTKNTSSNIFPEFIKLLKHFKFVILGLILVVIGSNSLSLLIPQIISNGIDSYSNGNFDQNKIFFDFGLSIIVIFVFGISESLFKTYVSEGISRKLRNDISLKISKLSYSRVQELSPSKLLTNLTSDVDNIKNFVSQGVSMIFSSVLLIIGASYFLFSTNWKLALAVIVVLPLIFVAFMIVFGKVGNLFKKYQTIIDNLNKTISESVISASLIRVLNTQIYEIQKFEEINNEAKSIGLSILKLFAGIFPIVGFLSNLITIIILLLGGHFVLNNDMTLGDFSAFLNYVGLLIFPIIMLGFLSNMMARAKTSLERVNEILNSKDDLEGGNINQDIIGNIKFENVSLNLDNREVLKNISFNIKANSKIGILGPTGSGKTQIFYLLAKLLHQNSGEILVDDINIKDFENNSLYKQMGLVFQDSVIFNTTIKENISFENDKDLKNFEKAIKTAELEDFINSLDNGLETIVSERGSSLSGGQKQRITLARALALNPKILLLDDFTARVDNSTEKKIFENISKNYPNLTLILITQKISSIKDFDNIILMMEGEILAQGTHKELLETSLEYQQIFNSQKSTEI